MATRVKLSRMDRFGMLTILEDQGDLKSKDKIECLCDCGVVCEKSITNVKSGHTRSCGCLLIEARAKSSITHGMRYSPEYSVWCSVKGRCSDLNNMKYAGRGISISEEWDKSFDAFYADMGPRPTDRHTIERKDVNGNYCKENCIWTDDLSLQGFNQRKKLNNTSGRTGVYWRADRDTWIVKVNKDGKVHGYGSFKNYDLAVLAVEKAEIELYGFSRGDSQ